MSGTLHFTDRDRELLQALAQRVRLFAQRQVADGFWNGELANARRRLKRLQEADLVTKVTVQARSLPPLEAPLFSWRQGRCGAGLWRPCLSLPAALEIAGGAADVRLDHQRGGGTGLWRCRP